MKHCQLSSHLNISQLESKGITTTHVRFNKLILLYCFLVFLFCFSSFTYYFLIVQGANDVFSADGKFSGIIIPDQIRYRLYSKTIEDVMSLSTKGIKNYIGPALLGYLLKGIQFGDIFLQ